MTFYINQYNKLNLTTDFFFLFSANGLKYHRGKTKGCDLPAGVYQLGKIDKSSNSEGDTEDSATEDFTTQGMSADESHHYHQHSHMNDKTRGRFIRIVCMSITSEIIKSCWKDLLYEPYSITN